MAMQNGCVPRDQIAMGGLFDEQYRYTVSEVRTVVEGSRSGTDIALGP